MKSLNPGVARSHFVSRLSMIVWVNVVWNTINWRDTTHFDSEDDYCTGCRNFSHCRQQFTFTRTIILRQFITSADQKKQTNKPTKNSKWFVYLSGEILRTRTHVIPCQLGRQVLWGNEDCKKKRKEQQRYNYWINVGKFTFVTFVFYNRLLP